MGRYSESRRHWDRSDAGQHASLLLNPDGSILVSGLPFEFGATTCTVSGNGKWSGPDGDQNVELTVKSDDALGSCKSDSYTFLELSGHSAPYDLYWILGDPDSGTGVWLNRK